MTEAGALQYLRKNGWAKIYRSEKTFNDTAPERNLADELGIRYQALDARGMIALEPALKPHFERAIYWPGATSLSNPLAVTKAYLARYEALGGVTLVGDARTLRREGLGLARRHRGRRAQRAACGGVARSLDAGSAGADGHPAAARHQARLSPAFQTRRHRADDPRPVVDPDNGYCVTPMQQGIRLTTGAEFADRDAPPTPVQFDRLMPRALEVYPLGERVDDKTWLGKRPCFPDSRPVVGPAPNKKACGWLTVTRTGV